MIVYVYSVQLKIIILWKSWFYILFVNILHNGRVNSDTNKQCENIVFFSANTYGITEKEVFEWIHYMDSEEDYLPWQAAIEHLFWWDLYFQETSNNGIYQVNSVMPQWQTDASHLNVIHLVKSVIYLKYARKMYLFIYLRVFWIYIWNIFF